MKCCVCNKEVDEKNNNIPPKWYGKYTCGKLIELICDVCIRKPEGIKKWK
jgi:hypothetical protein